MKIMIVEDDRKIAAQIITHLRESGLLPKVISDGEEALFEGENGHYDCIVLDLGLPSIDGISILEKWRATRLKTPVIILTARSSKAEIVRGLEVGADDYLTKPFDMEELTARIRAQLRRTLGKTNDTAKYKNVVLDSKSGRVTVNSGYVKLTRTEFLILQYLFMNQGRPISVNELTEHTYEDFDNDSGIIARHIANIRKKIGNDIIKTETNRGYYVPVDTE